MNKSEAGRLGGLSTLNKYGKDHFSAIGRKGAASTWARYRLCPAGVNGWLMVDRVTNKIKAKIHI
ncbi:MAG: hypothetical protein ACYS6W_14440 [Planctomycetota bacterium]|jgi:hypothetical protein